MSSPDTGARHEIIDACSRKTGRVRETREDAEKSRTMVKKRGEKACRSEGNFKNGVQLGRDWISERERLIVGSKFFSLQGFGCFRFLGKEYRWKICKVNRHFGNFRRRNGEKLVEMRSRWEEGRASWGFSEELTVLEGRERGEEGRRNGWKKRLCTKNLSWDTNEASP